MAHTKLYTAIYGVLFVVATIQVAVERMGFLESNYWLAFWAIIVLSAVKAVFVAAYYQHLRWEPPAVSYLVGAGVLAVIMLTAAASYSII